MPTILLTDAAIRKIPFADTSAGTLVRDSKLAGFVLRVGLKKKTLRFEGERRIGGKRKGISRALGQWPHVEADEARASALDIVRQIARGETVARPERGITLEAAFDDFKKSLASRARRTRPSRWSRVCEGTYARRLKPWADETLASLSAMPVAVAAWHASITAENGPYEANHAGRLLRAVYHHAQKLDRNLPALPPTTGILWNPERGADAAIPLDELPKWSKQVAALENPIRAAFHRLCLLLGARPGELARLRWTDVDFDKHTVTMAESKTGIDIIVPMTAPIEREFKKARAAGGIMYEGSPFVFPARASKHLTQWNEPTLSHFGKAGRHTHTTIAVDLGIDPIIIRRLHGHSIRDITANYTNDAALVGSSLMAAQKKISERILKLMKR